MLGGKAKGKRSRGVFQPQGTSPVTFWASKNNILGLNVEAGFVFPKGKRWLTFSFSP